jgi:tetratricopeptide (TPR) repeat protein
MIIAASCVVVAVGLGRSIWPRQRQAGAPAAIEAYHAGAYAWQKRTPADLHRAVDAFTRSIVADPGFAPAYVGLADCYNLLPEFGDLSPAEAYPRAQAAAERAVALDRGSAAAHRALAFSLFWWGADRDRAIREFRTSIKLDPNSAQTRHWYANALAAMLEPAAQTEIARAEELDPASTPIKADAGWIDYMLGHFNEAVSQLDEVAAVDPSFSTTFRYRAAAKRAIGDFPGMLADLRREAELGNNRDLSADADSATLALQSGGASAMFKSLARNEEQMFSRGQFAAGRLAADELLGGRQDRALELLAVAQSRHEWFASVITNPVFAPLRNKPSFRKLLRP